MLAPVSSISTFAIVAHPDDDLLFMNPDILHSIQSGEGHASVYLTAGDAGLDDDYWQGREEGIKAAYGEMSGANDWVDTEVTLSNGEQEFTVQSSFLESQPEVRLYFLRLPDGFSATETGYAANANSLEQLWDGAVNDLTTTDGANTYTGEDLIGTLHALLDFHQPATILVQDHETEFSDHSHADHVHGSMFAYEAHELYAENHEHDLVGYVDYRSNDLGQNVSSDDHQAASNAFYAYAQHDPEVHLGMDENGNPILLERFELWLERQYHTHEFEQVAEDETFGSGIEGSALDFHVCTFEDGVCVACDNTEEGTSSEQDDDSIFSLLSPDGESVSGTNEVGVVAESNNGQTNADLLNLHIKVPWHKLITGDNVAHTVNAEDQSSLNFLSNFSSWLSNFQVPAFSVSSPYADVGNASHPSGQFDSTNFWQTENISNVRPENISNVRPENISNVQPVNQFEDLFYILQAPGLQIEGEQNIWDDTMSQLFTPMRNEHDLAEEVQSGPENQNFFPEFV